VILLKVRDPRLVTIRRGGSLTDSDHELLALWAATCAEQVLDLFESAQPGYPRPRQAIEHARAWVRGEVKMMEARAVGAARWARPETCVALHGMPHTPLTKPGRRTCCRARAWRGRLCDQGRTCCGTERRERGCKSTRVAWQRDQLPEAIRELVLDDQRLRNDICWSVFEC
jgi:hypothetical protein